ncbi:MAG: transposase [Nanoarchaeota archaeon]
MPSRNSVKLYVENSYYHIYNRGVEKRIIFQDDQDYAVFLRYLKTYLSPKDVDGLRKQLVNSEIPWNEKDKILREIRLNNFNEEIYLIAFCLMPNHFHFLIKQNSSYSIDTFMNSLVTRYVMYFNRKYNRVGPLFQGVYKAVLVESESQLLYLTCYIHRNPLSLVTIQKGDPLSKQPSSYYDYLGLRGTEWIKRKDILIFFSKTNPKMSYKSFVEQTTDFTNIQPLILE